MTLPYRHDRDRIVDRRTLLGASTSAAALIYLTGCDLLSTDPEADGGQDGQPSGTTAGEAPMLAAMVEEGTLPPREERLPDNPLVVPTVDRIGTYGGTWRSLLISGQYIAWMDRQQHYDALVRYDPEWTEVIPDLAESYDINDDGAEYIFHLRSGIKWSDGEPFSADDIVFWYEAVLMNEELTPVKPTLLLSDGELPAVEAIDENTVAFRYNTPHGLLLRYLAGGAGDELVAKPRHYLEEFHKEFNPDRINDLVNEAGFDDWVQFFLDRADWSINPDLPVLSAWVVETPLLEGGSHIVAKRNPFYWKTDSEGNQLPYIDEIDYEVMTSLETALLKAQNGEFDMLDRHINTLQNKPVLAQTREPGNYEFFDMPSDLVNGATITLNMTQPNPVKREIYGNKDFRIGLSHAINRQEIIDTVYRGQGEPWQMSPREESGYYNEQLAKQYIEYDVDLANEHLDRAGYTERDGDGFRLGPDGNRITINLEATDQWDSPVLPDVAEMVATYWREVGVHSNPKNQSSSLLAARAEANEQDAMVDVDFGGINILMDPRAVFPHHGTEHFLPWIQWYESGGSDGEEPPEHVRRQMELYDRVRVTLDEEEQHRLMTEVVEIAAENFMLMGVVKPADGYGIVRNNVFNVPEWMYDSTGAWYATPGPTNPHQYFIETG